MFSSRPHPSDTIHEATDFADAIRRYKSALEVERRYLDDISCIGDPGTTDAALDEADKALAIWLRHLNLAKHAAAAEMTTAGLESIFATAVRDDDFGVLAI